jgi:hypothetical protein
LYELPEVSENISASVFKLESVISLGWRRTLETVTNFLRKLSCPEDGNLWVSEALVTFNRILFVTKLEARDITFFRTLFNPEDRSIMLVHVVSNAFP